MDVIMAGDVRNHCDGVGLQLRLLEPYWDGGKSGVDVVHAENRRGVHLQRWGWGR
jgi:hypothetical protein